MRETYRNKIIKWWNDNAFLNTTVSNLKDIKNLFNNEISPYKDIIEMISYHQEQSNEDYMDIGFYKDIKNYGLESPERINYYLKL